MALNATVKIEPDGTLSAWWNKREVAKGWMVINVEELADGKSTVISLLCAGQKDP